MRNRYPGPCYRCGELVAPGDGFFERYQRGWRVHHVTCQRKAKEERDRRDAQIDASRRAQANYLLSHGLQRFAPRDGICWRCKVNIYTLFTPEQAGLQLITSCPNCCMSFCE